MQNLNLCITLFLLASMLPVYAQSIVAAQYRINEGEPFNMTLVPDAEVMSGETKYSVDVENSGLPVGFHTVSVRMRSAEGLWSHWRSFDYLHVDGNTFLAGAEWFINNDPGEGNGVAIETPDDGAWDEPRERFSPEISGFGKLPEGRNTIYVRTRDQDGRWSAARSAVFETVQERITAAEWTLNPNTPVGEGSPLGTVDGAFDSGEEALVSDGYNSSTLPEGFHPRIYVRAQTNLGNAWSDANAEGASILLNRSPYFSEIVPTEMSIDTVLGAPIPASFSVQSFDPDNDFVQIRYLVNGEEASSDGVFDFHPETAETFTVTAQAVDDFDGTTIEHSWFVDVVENPVQVKLWHLY